ncbi:HPP family protein [Halomonas elongata]|uniref:HPP family protein n=1 Tax=Halomonas elongata TaxID=2746 RepID=UPI0038D4E194
MHHRHHRLRTQKVVERRQEGWRDALWSWMGVFSSMVLVGWLVDLSLPSQPLAVMSSFAATLALLYARPESPMAQPRNVIGGSVLSALIGVSLWQWLGSGWETVALATASALLVMQITRTLHPPGGIVALLAVAGPQDLHELGWRYALMPIASGCLVILAVAVSINTLARKRPYPHRWW